MHRAESSKGLNMQLFKACATTSKSIAMLDYRTTTMWYDYR